MSFHHPHYPTPEQRMHEHLARRTHFNQLRLICKEGDRGSLHVKSTLDGTYKMDAKTDDSISFTDADLVVVKNVRETECLITLKAIRLPGDTRAILRPSRGAHQVLLDKSVSEIRSSTNIVLHGGESLTICSSNWAPQKGGGAAFPV